LLGLNAEETESLTKYISNLLMEEEDKQKAIEGFMSAIRKPLEPYPISLPIIDDDTDDWQ